ncbi:MAG: hypothetical protein U5L96_07255 [Owenweeksia sp.]|nr:hypothetical protein [Owenweeksia sp.]
MKNARSHSVSKVAKSLVMMVTLLFLTVVGNQPVQAGNNTIVLQLTEINEINEKQVETHFPVSYLPGFSATEVVLLEETLPHSPPVSQYSFVWAEIHTPPPEQVIQSFASPLLSISR